MVEIINRTFFRNFTLRSALFPRKSARRHLPRQFFERAQVCDQIFAFGIVRVGIGIAANFGDGVERTLRRRVVAQHAIALANLFQGANGVRLSSRHRATFPCPSQKGCPNGSGAGLR